MQLSRKRARQLIPSPFLGSASGAGTVRWRRRTVGGEPHLRFSWAYDTTDAVALAALHERHLNPHLSNLSFLSYANFNTRYLLTLQTMAELALGILGVALAWKGIMDFGVLVNDLMADDEWTRDGLAMKLQASHFMLKDWGDFVGVTSDHGRFQTFESSRKELIARIIFRLRDSRANAQTRLEAYYGLSVGKGITNGHESHKGLSRLVNKVKDASRAAKNKAVWLSHDRDLVMALVKETVECHETLNWLTSLSPKFLGSMQPDRFPPSSLDSSLRRIEQKVEQVSRDLTQSALGFSVRNHSDGELDMQTLASFTTKAMTSSAQADRVRHLIEKASSHFGDTRITDTVAEWWIDKSGLLVLEGQDMSDDTTFGCVLLYSLVKCPKMIYSFPPQSSRSPLLQLHDMLRTLIRDMVSLAENQSLEGISDSFRIDDGGTPDIATAKDLMGSLLVLLGVLVDHSETPLLLIIDRMDLLSLDDDPEMSRLTKRLVTMIRNLCDSSIQGKLKVLLGYSGHAKILYDCVGEQGVVDLTDYHNDTSLMWEELVVRIHG